MWPSSRDDARGRLLRMIRQVMQLLIRTRFSFRELAQSDVVIFDAVGSREIMDLIGNLASSQVLHTRREVIRITPRIAYRTLQFKRRGYGRSTAYFAACLHSRPPSFLVTLVDNDSRFFEVAGVLPETRSVAIQNGNRFPETGGILPPEQFYPGHLLTFGEYEHDQYRMKSVSFLSATACGSLRSALTGPRGARNNYLPHEGGFDLCFVSSGWKPEQGMWFRESDLICRWLSRWLRANRSRTLVVALASQSQDDEGARRETEFYRRHFGEEIKVSARHDYTSTYRVMDSARVTVCAGTTSGLENLARGNLTLQCNPLRSREEYLPVDASWYLPKGNYAEFASRLALLLDASEGGGMSDEDHRSVEYFQASATRSVFLKQIFGEWSK